MNESNFDLEIKRILSDAREPVSPSVWEGVAAGLDRKRRRIPLWVWWSLSGAAAAAAILLVVLTTIKVQGPDVPFVEEQLRQSSLLSEAVEAPAPVPAPVQEWVPQAAPKASPTAPAAPATAPAVSADPVTPVKLAEEQPAPRTASETGTKAPQPQQTESAPQPTATAKSSQDESEQWARIIAEEETPKAKRGLEWTVSGNLQDRFRRNASGRALRRAPSSGRPAPTETGISWENPEYSFSIPFTAGIGVRVRFSDRWSLGTGVQYTNMSRSFIGDYVELDDEGAVDFELLQTDMQNMQHWVGVPLNVYFDILPKSRWRVHAFAGGTVEYLLNNHYLVHTNGNDIRLDKRGKGVQPSIGAGVGVELSLTPAFGLFFDPSVRYYFDTKQPRSIRTVQPLRMDLEAGVRFTL